VIIPTPSVACKNAPSQFTATSSSTTTSDIEVLDETPCKPVSKKHKGNNKHPKKDVNNKHSKTHWNHIFYRDVTMQDLKVGTKIYEEKEITCIVSIQDIPLSLGRSDPTLEYVRKVSSHLGITSRGLNKITCLKLLAELATGNYEVTKIVATQYSRPLNGKFRLINCIFSDLHFNNFLELSQQITKDNLTDGKNISSMKKEFFKQVLQTYNNDTSKYIDCLQY
jgi:hypothetical protein